MRVIVDLTYDELGEALAAVRAEHLKATKQRARKSPSRWAFVAVCLVLGLIVPQLYLNLMTDPYPLHRPEGYWSTIIMIPVFTIVLLGVIANIAGLWGNTKAIIKLIVGSLLPLGVICVALFVLTSGALFRGGRRGRFGAIPMTPDWYGTLMPQVPWLVFALLLLYATVRRAKQMQKLAWETNPRLARPKTVDLSVFGVAIDESDSQRTYQWPAIFNFIETAHLMILCPTELTFDALPKRCFASADEINAARALISHQLSASQNIPAFPVQPAPAPDSTSPTETGSPSSFSGT